MKDSERYLYFVRFYRDMEQVFEQSFGDLDAAEEFYQEATNSSGAGCQEAELTELDCYTHREQQLRYEVL